MNKIKISTPFRLASRRPIIWTAEKPVAKPTAQVVAMKLPTRISAFGRSRETGDQGRVAA